VTIDEQIAIMKDKMEQARKERAVLPRHSEEWAACCYAIGDLTAQIRRLMADKRRGAK